MKERDQDWIEKFHFWTIWFPLMLILAALVVMVLFFL